MNKTSKILTVSILTVVICVSLIVGATFALFESEYPTNIAVSSGKVKVESSISEFKMFTRGEEGEEVHDRWLNGQASEQDGEITLSNMAPCDGVEFDIDIVSSSTVEIKWQIQLIFNGDSSLHDVLDVEITGVDLIDTGTACISKWTNLEPDNGGEKTAATLHARIVLSENAGKAAQGKSCTITITVFAVQANAKTNDPVDKGESDDNTTYIYNLQDIKNFRNKVNEGANFVGQTVNLMTNIDFNDEENWLPIGTESNTFRGTFNGNGCTIFNLTVDQPDMKNVGFFGYLGGNGHIGNVVFSNANVSGFKAVGVVLGTSFNFGTVSDVTVVKSKVEGHDYVGGIAGYTYGNFNNCKVDNLTAIATPINNDGGAKVGGIVGYLRDSNYTVSDCSVTNSQITAWRDLGSVVGCYDGAKVLEKVTNITVDNVTLTVDHVNGSYSPENDGAINAREVIGRVNGSDADSVNATLKSTEGNYINNVSIVCLGVDLAQVSKVFVL